MKAKNVTLLTLMLLSLMVPFTSETQGEEKVDRPTKELRVAPKGAERLEILDQDILKADKEFQELLTKVENRLMAGEDPDTPMDLLVYWEEYQPDFPAWVDVQETFTLIPAIHVGCALEDVERLSELPYVSKVVENRKGTIAAPTSFSYGNDPYIGDYPLYLNETYPLVDASTPDTTAGAGTIIAVLSTGINDSHPMLNDFDDNRSTTNDLKVLDGYDAYSPAATNLDDSNGWGTALASIAAGTGAVGGQLIYNKTSSFFHRWLGTEPYETQEIIRSIAVGSQIGLAPGAALLDVNIYDTTFGTATSDTRVIRGMEWAVAHGADIILLQAERHGSSVVDAIEALTNCGVLVIVQAGDWDASTDAIGYDDGDVAPYYSIESPASAPSALTVGATTETDALWLRSNRGPVSGTETSKPDVVAPGVGVLAANYNWSEHEEGDDWDGNADIDDSLYFQLYDSTACAAAVAAGVSAQLIANFPGASPTAIKIALRQSALDLGFNEMAQGKGKIQLGAANDVLTAASKLADYYVGHYQEDNFSLTLPTYADFENYRVLIDGSFTTSFAGGLPDPHDWSEMPNGNLTRDTPHPYPDNAAGFTWYNFSFPGANFTDFYITGASVGAGDNITLWVDDNPAGTNIGTATVLWDDTDGAASPSSSPGEVYVFIRYYSDGNGDATTSDGINGTLDLQYMARTTSPNVGDDEFNLGLVPWLTSMGATVHYWHAAGANMPPTATILEYYDAYFLPQPLAGTNFAAMGMPNETAYYQYLAGNLSSYLAAGGNFLFLGDNEYPYYNYATSPFNITWHEGGAGGPTTQIVPHNITTTPYAIEELLIAAPLTYLGGGGTTIVTDVNVPSIVAYEPVGGGKAIFIADEDMFNDPRWIDPATDDPEHENSLLAANIFYWFFNVTKDSGSTPGLIELDVSYYKAPKVMANGSQWSIEAEIQNIGNVTAGALVTFGMGWGSTWTGPLGGTLTTDNWDGSYAIGPGGDGDVGTLVNGADTIEFHYNITLPVDLDRLGLYYIEMEVGGIDSSADCHFYFNGYDFGALPATNATPWPTTGTVYYTFDANGTNQPALYQTFNNITIVVPAGTDLFVDNFLIEAYEFDASSDGQVAQVETGLLAPGAKTTVTFNYTPVLELGTNHSTTLEPLILVYPANWTWAYAIMEALLGYTVTENSQQIEIDYGTSYTGTGGGWEDLNAPVNAMYKSGRRGDLPLLYEITPAGFDLSTSVKIIKFPGDIRVDGLTVMTSRPLEDVSLELTGEITSVVGLGNASMASAIADYSDPTLAPDWFYLNRTWERTTLLPLEELNHTSIEVVLQTHVLPTTPNGTISGFLRINSGASTVFEIPLSLTIEIPKASFLLIDDTIDSIGTERNYDKLWDSVFEAWKIAANAGYDIDSLYQETYLYQYRNHEIIGSGMETTTFLDDYIVNLPCEEELFYAAFMGVGVDSSYGGVINDFIGDGGTVIEFTPTNSMGTGAYDTFTGYGSLAHTLLGNSSNPLMANVSQLLYMGGYFDIPQTIYDNQLNYDVLSGLNWAGGNLSVEVAGIFHDAIYPYRFSWDSGLYSYPWWSHDGAIEQDINGTKIAVAGELIAQSWFLEQMDIWGYFVMQSYAEDNVIPKNFDVDLDNDQFIENIFHVGANQAPTILDVTVSPMHISNGDEITVWVNVSDDWTPTEQLHVVGPEKLQNGLTGDLYDEFTYNATLDQFIGTFRVLDVYELEDWNIFVWDDMYRVSEAIESCGQHLIPRINVLPSAWALNFIYEETNQILDVSRGDLIQVPIYFSDFEDGEGIDCNASLVYYKNKEETDTIFTEYFSGMGFGIFFVDTSGLTKDGTYLVEATVGDSDGGIATYRVAGFNIGAGTLYREKGEEALNLAPVLVFVTTAGLGVGALAGGIFLFLKRRG